MAPIPPSGPQRPPLSGLSSSQSTAPTEFPETSAFDENFLASIVPDRYFPAPLAFVLFAFIELAFVFGLLVLTKLAPSEILRIAGVTTAISVAGFFGRNAIIVVGRRLVTGFGNQ